jgi:hypothetical protein
MVLPENRHSHRARPSTGEAGNLHLREITDTAGSRGIGRESGPIHGMTAIRRIRRMARTDDMKPGPIANASKENPPSSAGWYNGQNPSGTCLPSLSFNAIGHAPR